MVVTNKSTHHVACLFHGSKHTGINSRGTSFFHTRTIENSILIGSRFIIFGQGNVEECQSRQRFPIILSGKGSTLLTIPVYLIEREPVVPFHIGQLGIRMRVEAIEHRSIFLAIRRLHCKNVIGRFDCSAIGLNVVRHGTDDIIELGTGFTLFIIMVTESNNKRQLAGRSTGKHGSHSRIRRCGINHISCENNQVGTFGIKHFIDTLQSNIRSRITILEVDVGKLDDFKLSVLVKL